MGQSTPPLFSLLLQVVGGGLGLIQWLGCRPLKQQQLVSAWVRTPSPTADHFHSPPVVSDWVIKGVGFTPPASVPLEVRRTGNISLLAVRRSFWGGYLSRIYCSCYLFFS